MNCLKTLLFRPSWFVKTAFYSVGPTVSSIKPPLASGDIGTAEKLPKRMKRQTRAIREWNVLAYTTAESYDLHRVTDFFQKQPLFEHRNFGPSDLTELVRLFRVKKHPPKMGLTGKQQTPEDYANISVKSDSLVPYFYVFAEGAIVFWNCANQFCTDVITKLSRFADFPLERRVIESEIEKLFYIVDPSAEKTHFKREDLILRSTQDDDDSVLEGFAISQAMVASVKLSINELSLENFIETLEPTIKSMKLGSINLEKSDVLKNSGYMFELRHKIIYSDLLDVLPDFYWDRGELAKLYTQAYGLLSIGKRTRVINEKLNYCLEFDERVSTHLMTEHSHKLEVYIIGLILIEVILGVLMLYFGVTHA